MFCLKLFCKNLSICFLHTAGQTLVLYSESEADRVAAALGNKAISMDQVVPLLRNMVTTVSKKK